MDKPVGIDIEEIQFDRDVAKAILDKDEYAAVCKSEEPDVEFTKLWTLKESYLKLTGEGIRNKMKDVLTEADAIAFTTVVNRSAGYVYSTALFKQAGRSITITN